LSLVLTPLRVRWTIPLKTKKYNGSEHVTVHTLYRHEDQQEDGVQVKGAHSCQLACLNGWMVGWLDGLDG
jgi:hypothetical protein